MWPMYGTYIATLLGLAQLKRITIFYTKSLFCMDLNTSCSEVFSEKIDKELCTYVGT
jgi:hypothetical protein